MYNILYLIREHATVWQKLILLYIQNIPKQYSTIETDFTMAGHHIKICRIGKLFEIKDIF